MRSWSNCKFHVLACRPASNLCLSDGIIKPLARRTCGEDAYDFPYIADQALFCELKAALARRTELQQLVANEGSVREKRSNFEIRKQQDINHMTDKLRVAAPREECKTSTHDALKTKEISSSRTTRLHPALFRVNSEDLILQQCYREYFRAIRKHLPDNFEGHLEHRRRLKEELREAFEDLRPAPELLKPLKATKESWDELDRKASQKMQAIDSANMDLHHKLNSSFEDQINKIVGKRMDAVLKETHDLKAQVARLTTQVDTLSKNAVKHEQLTQQMQLVDDNQRQHDRWLNGVTDLANALRGHVDQHKKVLDEAQPGLMARHAPS